MQLDFVKLELADPKMSGLIVFLLDHNDVVTSEPRSYFVVIADGKVGRHCQIGGYALSCYRTNPDTSSGFVVKTFHNQLANPVTGSKGVF